jgi:Transketolase, thiamine diphosphate binding domain
VLAIDAVQKANSGHPGMPIGTAPIAYLLFTRYPGRRPYIEVLKHFGFTVGNVVSARSLKRRICAPSCIRRVGAVSCLQVHGYGKAPGYRFG